jgi:hypothetical protein
LYFFNARYYSGALGRFVSADTIVPQPGNPQAFNRYSYVTNNPVKYTDPSGHCRYDENGDFTYDENCTLEEFAGLSWEHRQSWLLKFIGLHGLGDWLNDIYGAVGFLASDRDFSNLGGWAAHADAGVLQGLQDGWRIHEGKAAIGRYVSGNSSYLHLNGGGEWARFFDMLDIFNQPGGDQNDGFTERLIAARLGAEQMGVNYGREYAQGLYDHASLRLRFKIDQFNYAADEYRRTVPLARQGFITYSGFDPPMSSKEISALRPDLDPRTSWPSLQAQGQFGLGLLDSTWFAFFGDASY